MSMTSMKAEHEVLTVKLAAVRKQGGSTFAIHQRMRFLEAHLNHDLKTK